MTHNAAVFHLKIQQVEQVCLFELSWGKGQQLSVKLRYPEILTTLYHDWQQIYITFYKKALRGRVAAKGSFSGSPVDWHAKLVQAEAKLLYEFHRWLRSEELYEIRAAIARAAREHLGETRSRIEDRSKNSPVDVFLTCDPLDLERLPWEAWEIGTEFAALGKIRIVRKPIAIRETTVNFARRRPRRKARVLVILGDDTGLNFQADKEAVESIARVADIQFVGWQPNKNIAELKEEIVVTIADESGWDLLLFAGHSNETILTGGEIAIAPGAALSLSEIKQSLLAAKQRGLQFALFNSCNGLSIANALIDLGLSQVAVMREPVHNQVAQEFLLRFLQNLADYKDVHDSLLAACQFLKLEKHLTYPSAYLIPSLFRHPDAPLFCLEPFGIRKRIERGLPTKHEAIALLALSFVSLQLPIQDLLLEHRVFFQAVYRDKTNQIKTTDSPPVLLVQIDEDSIKKAKISNPRPMDRSYLAKIVDKLTQKKAKVIGIDYLLDRYQPEHDATLANSLRSSVEKQGTWFVFASSRNNMGGWFEVLPELADPNWSLQGDIRVLGNPKNTVRSITLAPMIDSSSRRMPFPYLLALTHCLNTEQFDNPPQPQLNSATPLLSQLKYYIFETTGKDYRNLFSRSARLHRLTNFSYRLGQKWLHPIIDYSIPPDRVYQRLPAWKLLESSPDFKLFQGDRPQVVTIVAGGYGEAGISGDGQDNFPLPTAVGYWRSRQTPPDPRLLFTGGEIHAYTIQHFLDRRLVVPIPNLWLIAIAALLGKLISIACLEPTGKKHKKNKFIFASLGFMLLYGVASFQIYVSAAVLLPVFLPGVTLGIYMVLAVFKRKDYA